MLLKNTVAHFFARILRLCRLVPLVKMTMTFELTCMLTLSKEFKINTAGQDILQCPFSCQTFFLTFFSFLMVFSAIKSVEMVPEGVKLKFFQPQPILMFLDQRENYTIPISDKDQLLLLCIMLRDCIRAAGM